MRLLQFKPKDIIAAITVSGLMYLKLRGVNGNVDTVLALILGYYFAHRADGKDTGT